MSILVSSLLSAQKRTSLGCRAGIRTRACRTASRRTTIWAAPHLAELRRTLFYSRKWLPGEKGGTRWNGLIMLFDNWSDQDSIKKISFPENFKLHQSIFIRLAFQRYVNLYTYKPKFTVYHPRYFPNRPKVQIRLRKFLCTRNSGASSGLWDKVRGRENSQTLFCKYYIR